MCGVKFWVVVLWTCTERVDVGMLVWLLWDVIGSVWCVCVVEILDCVGWFGSVVLNSVDWWCMAGDIDMISFDI